MPNGEQQRVYLSALASTLWKFQQDDVFCDTALVTRGSVELSAHSAVLGAVSAKLRVALNEQHTVLSDNTRTPTVELESLVSSPGGKKSSKAVKLERSSLLPELMTVESTQKKYRLFLLDYEAAKLEAVLRFMYTGELDAVTNSLIHPVDRLGILQICEQLGLDVTSFQHSTSQHPTTMNGRISTLKAYSDIIPSSQGIDQFEIPIHVNILSRDASVEMAENDFDYSEIVEVETFDHEDYLEELDEYNNNASGNVETKLEPLKWEANVLSNDADIPLSLKMETKIKEDNKFEISNDCLQNEANDVTVTGNTSDDIEYVVYATPNQNARQTRKPKEVKKYECQACLMTFTRKVQLILHANAGCNVVQCQVCEKTFRTREQLERHSRSDCAGHVQSKAAAVVAERTSSSGRSKRSSTGTLRAKRLIAGNAEFQDEEILDSEISERSHEIRAVEPDVDVDALRVCEGRSSLPRFICPKCGKIYYRAHLFESHILSHNGGKALVCHVCGKGFYSESNLKIHLKSHSGERPYACKICDKRFVQFVAVKEHEKIHAGHKNFVCDTCGKMFMTYAQLYSHNKIHVGVKNFMCEVCHKRFFTNGDMLKHQRIHRDERAFVCSVCGKSFKYSSNLHMHSRIHKGVRPYACPVCNKTFINSSHLSRHSKLHTRSPKILKSALPARITLQSLVQAMSPSEIPVAPEPQPISIERIPLTY